MEQIIEIFADSISSFIQLSIRLQEQNVKPQPELRSAADAVVLTSRELVKIARAKGTGEYADYEEIQADIFDCCDRVTDATSKFSPAMDALYGSADRVDGWRRLVNATQMIASQTSRLLLVVFGAEHRRLMAAGLALLDTCAVNKSYALMQEADVKARANDIVETTNKNSSQLMVFTSYVQARARETEGHKQKQMTQAVSQFNQLNERIVNGCNGLCQQITKETREEFIRSIGETEKLTREILDLCTPPEDSDIFRLVQSLHEQRATHGSLGANANRSTPLGDAALRLKKELKPLFANTITAPNARTAAGLVDRAGGDFCGLARAKVADTKDAERRARMAANLAAIERERTNLANVTAKFVQAPSANTANVMNATARTLDGLVDDFMADVRPEAVLCVPGSGEGLNTRLEAIEAAAESAKDAIRRVQNGIGTMSDDDLSNATSDASKKLAKYIEHLKAKQALEQNAAMKAHLADQIRLLNADNAALVADVNKHIGQKGDANAKRAAIATCEKTILDIDNGLVRIRNGAQQKTAKSFEDKIDNAANDIRDARDEFNMLPPSLKSLSTELADLMQKLAHCARTGDRNGIIETSRKIAEVVKNIKAETKKLGDSCRDPQLRDNILTASTAMTNFGTQLKILASVKAASVGKDAAAENQLVSCCEGIAQSVRTAMYNCQSGKKAGKI